MSSFDDAIQVVLEHEGHFVNDPVDPGGATKYGISLRFLKSIDEGDFDFDGDIDVDDIRSMNIDAAINIYREHWWDKYKYGFIEDQDLATKLFDLSVNMGARQAHKLLQRGCIALGRTLKVDGIIGDKTLYAIDHIDEECLIGCLRSEAAGFYRTLIAANRKYKKYERGWLTRAYD